MAEFFDIEGEIPVSLGQVTGSPYYCSAWDVHPPRLFDPASARRNGTPITEEAFRQLVSRLRPG